MTKVSHVPAAPVKSAGTPPRRGLTRTPRGHLGVFPRPAAERMSGEQRTAAAGNGGSDADVPANREAVYEELQPLIRRLLYQFGKTPELRQDLAGELYYRFCRLMADFDPSRGIPLSPYLVHMLQQHAYNYVRTFWREEGRTSSLELEESNGNIPAADESSNCLKRLITEELLDALPPVIAKLPHRQRLVVVWRYYEYRSFEDIAETLAIQPATARSLLRHGLEAMRRQLRLTGFLDR